MVRHGWEWRVKTYGSPPAPSIDPLMHSGPAYTEENDPAPPLGDDPRIVIVGAGPTGLCAGYRLTELGYTNWEMIEGSSKPAGLACTIEDENKFKWDIGVHCIFSHFEFFDLLMDEMLPPSAWLYHQRYSPARMRNTWVGYPVQANLWRLPEKEVMGIVADLAQKAVAPTPPKPRDFREWLHASFGKALTDTFMAPYNAKVWAHPADEMNSIWVGERVATIKLDDVLSNVIRRKDAPAWGPNAVFRYPMNGTGHVWEKVFNALPNERKRLGKRVKAVRTAAGKKALELDDGSSVPFDGLLSTMPVVELLRMTPDHPQLAELAEGDNGAADHSRFKHQTVNLVGVGVHGTDLPAALNGVHWVYFPEDEYLFYRVTVLSNFSPLMTAVPGKQWSLLIEVSESRHRRVPRNPQVLRRRVVEGLHASGMLPRNASIASIWSKRLEYGYPVPYVERNMHMHAADDALRKLGIWSRGRFGSWKYEVGNQDHSCMLGVDAVDAMLFGGNAAGREATFNVPNVVNTHFRKYDWDFEPSALSKRAKRKHTFGAAPRRFRARAQWDWVTTHCREPDDWVDGVREVMVGQLSEVKWLVHGYERCGVAETKRPMAEMLREGLNHHDRIPHALGTLLSGWVRHIVAHYAKLPQTLYLLGALPTRGSGPLSSREIAAAREASADFGVWGSGVARMTDAMRADFCARLWPLVPEGSKARRDGDECPSSLASTSEPQFFVSRRRVLGTGLATWRKLLALLEHPTEAERNEKLLRHSLHVFLGQPPHLPQRLMRDVTASG